MFVSQMVKWSVGWLKIYRLNILLPRRCYRVQEPVEVRVHLSHVVELGLNCRRILLSVVTFGGQLHLFK